MQAAHRWQEGDTTFDVEYCPGDAAAKLKEEDPDAWPGDYCMKTRVFSDFASAAHFACDAAPTDFFGVVTISKEVCENPKYDWWETAGIWDVEADTKPSELDAETPHRTDS